MSAPVAPSLAEPVLGRIPETACRRQNRIGVGVMVTLFKLRVVALLLVAAFGGLILASGGMPGLGPATLLLITGGMSAAGASALNQYLERERDGLMERTGRRPLPQGQIAQPYWALLTGLGLVIMAVLIAWPFNPLLALFLFLGAAIYVGVYTLWLKPRTLTNIVIGGAAGSCAVLSGGAAVGPWQNVTDPGVLFLALLVFAWTPTHFWSLALAYRGDYARAGVPMLPVQTGPRQAAVWILIHTALTGLIALALASRPTLGPAYLVITGIASAWLWRRSVHLVHRPDRKRALALFVASNAYLGLVLLAASVETLIRSYL